MRPETRKTQISRSFTVGTRFRSTGDPYHKGPRRRRGPGNRANPNMSQRGPQYTGAIPGGGRQAAHHVDPTTLAIPGGARQAPLPPGARKLPAAGRQARLPAGARNRYVVGSCPPHSVARALLPWREVPCLSFEVPCSGKPLPRWGGVRALEGSAGPMWWGRRHHIDLALQPNLCGGGVPTA